MLASSQYEYAWLYSDAKFSKLSLVIKKESQKFTME